MLLVLVDKLRRVHNFGGKVWVYTCQRVPRLLNGQRITISCILHHQKLGFEIVMMLIAIYGISYLYTYSSQHYLHNINSVHFDSCLERIIELTKTQTLTFPMLHTSYLLLHWAPPHHLPNLHHTRAYIYIYIEYIYIYCIYIYIYWIYIYIVYIYICNIVCVHRNRFTRNPTSWW